jgi:dynein heavy chain, axonemal
VTACAKKGLEPNDLFRLKVVQLEELLDIRHCVFVMGPPACGKSMCWHTLQAARMELQPPKKTKVVDLDPKAVTPEELYGYVHPATREWKDGLLSKIMRDMATEPNDDPKWMLLDGDLSTNWIESVRRAGGNATALSRRPVRQVDGLMAESTHVLLAVLLAAADELRHG